MARRWLWRGGHKHQAQVALSWGALAFQARVYVAAVIVTGALGLIAYFPRALPQPGLFAALLALAAMTSAWKVNLPIPLTSGVTLSVSYAACLMSLLLLGAEQAILITAVGVWLQCTVNVKEPYPLYRTVFSVAASVITMIATAAVYDWLRGPSAALVAFESAKPIVGAIATYFVVNTTLIAGVIAFSTRQALIRTWRTDFLWLGASFMVAGGTGALAAVVVAAGQQWRAVLLIAPIYLTYRTYRVFVARLEDEKRHVEEVERLHGQTVAALDEARRARASAEDANRLKDQFLAVVSHELRTPLNAILGWADMLRRGKLDAALTERAALTIYSSAQRQAELIEDLLDVARITSGKLRLDRGVVDVRDVVRDALQLVQPGAELKNITVTFDAGSEPAPVLGDAARLQQIVVNLLSNAVKFTPAGGAIRTTVRRLDRMAEIAVTDSGQGFTRDFHPFMFEAFRQADGTTTRAHSGLGLGLSIVKNLVDAHGGTVAGDSPGEGRGATFTVQLPLVSLEDAFERTQATGLASEAGAASLAGVSVLVVDDDEPTREIVAAHLQHRDATVVTAASAAEAMDLLQRHHVDVMLADIGMPDEDGYSLIRKVRALDKPEVASIPAAALTAFARDQDKQLAIGAGFQLHVPKPADAQALAAAVAQLRRLAVSGNRSGL
jgi:signal transduction histidine kinase/ActR/RegA family two-component response regulator